MLYEILQALLENDEWTKALKQMPSTGRGVTEGLKMWYAAAAMLLVVAWPALKRAGVDTEKVERQDWAAKAAPIWGPIAALWVFTLVLFNSQGTSDPMYLPGITFFSDNKPETMGMLSTVALFAVTLSATTAAAYRWLGKRIHVGVMLLAVLTTLSVANYARWGMRSTQESLDSYDLIHYYLNTKYFDELGYLDLYPACILADHDNGGPKFDEGKAYMAQDETGHSFKPISHAIARGKVVREENFTPERWDAFEHDFLYLQRVIPGMNSKLWRQMILDHGFNGTTVWTMIAEPLTQLVPVEQLKWLGYLDIALLAAGLAAVGWAYGWEATLWTCLWLMVTYSMRWPTVSWAFLRYDYVAALMMAMAAIRKGYPLVAGMLTGWSATLRMFPAFWLWFPFTKGIVGLTRKHVSKPLLILAGGFFLSVGVLEVASIARFGTDSAQTHLENMLDHNDPMQLSSRRIGLALALPYRGELEPKFISKERKLQVADQKPVRYGLALMLMLALGWSTRKLRDDEVFALGFIPIFLLTTMSYYYYVTRVTLAMWHASDLTKARNQVGLLMLFGIEVMTNFAETHHSGYRVYLVGHLAWGLAIYTLVMFAWTLFEANMPDPEESAPTPKEPPPEEPSDAEPA